MWFESSSILVCYRAPNKVLRQYKCYRTSMGDLRYRHRCSGPHHAHTASFKASYEQAKKVGLVRCLSAGDSVSDSSSSNSDLRLTARIQIDSGWMCETDNRLDQHF